MSRAYSHKMNHNRTAKVFYTIGFMLGGYFGYISGVVSTEGMNTLPNGLMDFPLVPRGTYCAGIKPKIIKAQ